MFLRFCIFSLFISTAAVSMDKAAAIATVKERLLEYHPTNVQSVSHYTLYLPTAVKNCIADNTNRSCNYRVSRIYTSDSDKIRAIYSGCIEINQQTESISPERAERLFKAFIKNYNLVEKTPREWLAEAQQKLTN